MTNETQLSDDDLSGKELPQAAPSGEQAAPAADDVLDQNLDDTNPNEAIEARPQWGSVSMLAAVQSLGGIVPGAGIIEAAYSNMFRAVEMHGLFSISNGGGSLEEYFLEQNGIVDDEGHKRDKDDDDNLSVLADMVVDQREEQRREQEEWSRSTHELTGVEMTGEEWGELADAVGVDGPLHQKLVDKLMANGKRTKAEAEKKAKDYEEVYRTMNKPEAQQTADEKQKLQAAKKDPEFTVITQALKSRSRELGQVNGVEQTISAATQNISTNTRDNVLDVPSSGLHSENIISASTPTNERAVRDFPSAPDLSAHHAASLAATTPLDAPKAPVAVAAIPPTPAPGGGLDV